MRLLIVLAAMFLLASHAEARTITESAIPYAQVCVTHAPGPTTTSSLRFTTLDSNGVELAEQTVDISSAASETPGFAGLVTETERQQMIGLLEVVFLRLHAMLHIPTPSPSPEPTPEPTATPEPTPTAIE